MTVMDFIQLLFSKVWELLSIKWPGFEFSIGTVFLASLATVAALVAIMKMVGVNSLTIFDLGSIFNGNGQRGGNNKNIKVSNERKNDTK